MRLRTLKQIEASRANGAKSRGPAAEKARLAAERNAVRYGLLASTVVLPGESEVRFLELIRLLAAQLKPANAIEASVIDALAIARWRQLRIAALQKCTMQIEMARHEGPAPNRAIEALKDQDGSLAALRRQEVSFSREFESALRLLLKLKGHRLCADATAILDLTAAGSTWDPDPPPLEKSQPEE